MTTQETPTPVTTQDIIPASGATDGIRYVLDADHAPSDLPKFPTPPAGDGVGGTPSLPIATDTTGIADLVATDASEDLPDRTASTVRGGQVARESKRGAY
jgi:hypothetical protein